MLFRSWLSEGDLKMMTDRMNEGCLVKIGMVTCVPDKQVRVRAGGGKASGNHAPMAPHTLARNLGGACRADPMRLQAFFPHPGS